MVDAENKIIIFSTKERSICSTIRTENSIQRIWPNFLGNKAVCIDKAGKAFLLNFISEKETEIDGFNPQLNKIIWDTTDPNLFIACSTDTAYTFIHNKNFFKGDNCSIVYELLSLQDVEKANDPSFTSFDGVEPIFIQAGTIVCLTKSNSIQSGWLGTHSSYANFNGSADDSDTNLRYFFQNLMLGKFENALAACNIVPEEDRPGAYLALATLALKNMNILVAKKANQLAGNISMVYTLDSMLGIEEKKVLQGFISMVFCDYQTAQEYLLTSSSPELGLDLRCDTKEWSIALNLAEQMAPDRVPYIRRRFAEDQEKQGQHAQALKNFQSSVIDDAKLPSAARERAKHHNMLCQAGIARTSIRTDNPTKGFDIGQDLNDRDLIWDIASALEEVKSTGEAAELFEKAEDYEKAAVLYIASKNFKKAETLIDKLTTPKVLASLAKMKETEGKFKDAENAYVRAKDWESVIKLNLTKLNDYKKAVKIFEEKSPTQACANILAEYCEGKGMRAETIKFMVLAGKHNDAFSKAQVFQEMEMYASSLEDLNEKEALKIAQYYEGVSKFRLAGTYYEKAGKHTNAMDCYVSAGDEAIDQAIDCVSKSQNETLFFKMLDYLEGDDTHDPKDPKFAFKLYLTFGKIEEASKIAIAIVKSEMEEGNYKEAHRILIYMLTEILERKAKISFELIQKTIIIHSYTLVR
jgi:WD repeat-containing protein 19